jgi:hypothetical protein
MRSGQRSAKIGPDRRVIDTLDKRNNRRGRRTTQPVRLAQSPTSTTLTPVVGVRRVVDVVEGYHIDLQHERLAPMAPDGLHDRVQSIALRDTGTSDSRRVSGIRARTKHAVDGAAATGYGAARIYKHLPFFVLSSLSALRSTVVLASPSSMP